MLLLAMLACITREPRFDLYGDDTASAAPTCAWAQDALRVIDVASVSIEGLVATSYRWTRNGQPLPVDTSELSVRDWASRGDEIGVVVSDGEERLDCGSLPVVNTPPQGGVVVIGDPTVAFGAPMQCRVLREPTDPDGDAVSLSVSWTVDGEPYDGADSALPGDTVSAEDVRAGQVWTCSLHSHDGADTGTSLYRRRVLVLEEGPLELQYVPAGPFEMGRSDDAVCAMGEQTPHEVTLTQGFWIGATEVTQAQFSAVMGFNPSHFEGCEDCPVERESWHEAVEFAGRLSELFGAERCTSCTERTEAELDALHKKLLRDQEFAYRGCRYVCDEIVDPYTCGGFRLPTEAEWEYAARGGPDYTALGDFTDGGSLEGEECELCSSSEQRDDLGVSLDSMMWYGCSAESRTHAVAQLQPNALGMYDVAGNVFEWCADQMNQADYPEGDGVDPFGVEGGVKVLRGGGYDSPAYQTSLGQRWLDPADSCYVYRLGFRVVMTDP